jgi:hypothetical protein
MSGLPILPVAVFAATWVVMVLWVSVDPKNWLQGE